MVKVYLIRFEENGISRWWHQSLDRDLAFALARKLALQGCKPKVHRFDVLPNIENDRIRLKYRRAS